MSLTPPLAEIDYPESDGKPMGESDIHRQWMFRIHDMLSYRYRQERVYIGSNLLVFYEEEDPREFIVPDVFVVLDCEPGLRRTFLVWEEQRVPDVVFEVTSRSTRREDEIFKPKKYARMGVKELILYDPTADYLKPALQGFRIDDDEVIRMAHDSFGRLRCETLGVLLHLDDRRLVLADAQTGERLPTEAEAERAGREAERAARKFEQQRREEAEARADADRAARDEAEARADAEAAARRAAEEELHRLRDQLRQQGDPS